MNAIDNGYELNEIYTVPAHLAPPAQLLLPVFCFTGWSLPRASSRSESGNRRNRGCGFRACSLHQGDIHAPWHRKLPCQSQKVCLCGFVSSKSKIQGWYTVGTWMELYTFSIHVFFQITHFFLDHDVVSGGDRSVQRIHIMVTSSSRLQWCILGL